VSPSPPSIDVRADVPLAPLVSLELGGRAAFFARVEDEAGVAAALRWAAEHSSPTFVLGGGTNVVVADAGFPGLVLQLATRGVTFEEAGDRVLVTAAAGEPWDEVVEACVARGLAGIECLSGIPGLAGATPIQNVGAYGQEVSDTIRSVRVMDRASLVVRDVDADTCAFGYRDSAFKRAPDREVVLSVTFALRAGGAPTVRYAELADALAGAQQPPTVEDVRTTVRALRARKSMLLDASDPNRRSVGSFFTNPVLSVEEAELVVARAIAAGVASSDRDVPRFRTADGRVKLAAGWLIERAGIAKGLRRGPVGVSTRHALALVHHGGGTTADLLALAREVRDAVRERFGIDLAPEPVLVGCAWPTP
jgi:UDP-N-acetylmuramate dehydrogenase